MWLLCTALTAQLAVVSQRKIFHCKDDLVKRPYVPHAPREPVYVYSLPITFIQGRGERLDYRKNYGWSSPIALHPSVRSSGLVHPSTTLQPKASYSSLQWLHSKLLAAYVDLWQDQSILKESFLPEVSFHILWN